MIMAPTCRYLLTIVICNTIFRNPFTKDVKLLRLYDTFNGLLGLSQGSPDLQARLTCFVKVRGLVIYRLYKQYYGYV